MPIVLYGPEDVRGLDAARRWRVIQGCLKLPQDRVIHCYGIPEAVFTRCCASLQRRVPP